MSGRLTEAQWTFKNGDKSIDFVLVWDKSFETSNSEISQDKRKIFEANLCEEGLEIENDFVEETGLHCVKIHAPCEVLRRYTEILKLRMPMKEELYTGSKHCKQSSLIQLSNYISQQQERIERPVNAAKKLCFCWTDWFSHNIFVDKEAFPDSKQRFTAVYSRDKEYLFDIESPEFFTPSIKSRIVQFILDRTMFKNTETQNVFCFGIDRLLASYVYTAAYPLHDGDLSNSECVRYRLLHQWASIRKWYRYQPIDHIRNYFGVKIGLYFAWLGFYTHMLFPAAIVGVLCFIVSLYSLPKNKPTQDICSKLHVKMCPLWDYSNYWELDDTCFFSKITFLFDNYTTVFFAVFMSFWAAMFLEMWKRYSAEITHRWDLTGFDTQEEHPRPQYLAHLARLDAAKKAHYRLNVITNKEEPKVPFWKFRFPAIVFSFSMVLLLVILAVAAVIGVILYRMALLAALSIHGTDSIISSNAIIITSATAASFNLALIFFFNWMYDSLAEYLTELEMQRTQTEFDDSLTLKMYLLQFVNYYASIFYIAFCKGKLIGSPAKYRRWFGYRQEECGPGGCLLELSIQLAIIMVGKQASNTCLEMIYPVVYKWWNSRTLKRRRSEYKPRNEWERDYKLVEWGSRALFPEYLEMVLQYGFVTIFVSAFPLAPLFALLNNILECRLDAKKLVTYHRRPVAQRVRDIGVWFSILDSVSKLAVVTNGFIIAFTSDFVPQLIYSMVVSTDNSLTGYMNHSLAYVSIEDLDMNGKPNSTLQYCRYKEYREPPWVENKYDTTILFWYVLAARLAFVVLFENLVVILVLAVQWIIPDIPGPLRDQIRREAYMTNEMIIQQEARRTHFSRSRQSLHSLSRSNSADCGDPLTPTRNSKLPYSENFIPLVQKPKTKFSKQQIQDSAMLLRNGSFGEINEESV